MPLCWRSLISTTHSRPPGGLDTWTHRFAQARGLERGAEAVKRERSCPSDFEYLRDELTLSESSEKPWCEYVDGIARSVRCFPGT